MLQKYFAAIDWRICCTAEWAFHWLRALACRSSSVCSKSHQYL